MRSIRYSEANRSGPNGGSKTSVAVEMTKPDGEPFFLLGINCRAASICLSAFPLTNSVNWHSKRNSITSVDWANKANDVLHVCSGSHLSKLRPMFVGPNLSNIGNDRFAVSRGSSDPPWLAAPIEPRRPFVSCPRFKNGNSFALVGAALACIFGEAGEHNSVSGVLTARAIGPLNCPNRKRAKS